MTIAYDTDIYLQYIKVFTVLPKNIQGNILRKIKLGAQLIFITIFHIGGSII